jgi:hypothetical protein
VNDNYNYLPYFFGYPELSLTRESWHMYGAFVWPSFLVENYGIDVIRSAFEFARYNTSLRSLDSALIAYGARVSSIFPEFALWNYFTGDRADTAYHDDGADYPLVAVSQVMAPFPFTGQNPALPPEGLAANYVLTSPSAGENGYIIFDFDGGNQVLWELSLVAFWNDGEVEIRRCPTDFYGRAECGFYDYAMLDSIILIPCATTVSSSGNTYTFDAFSYPFGDVDYSGEVNILDIVYLINHKYKAGPPPERDIRIADVKCDGEINILDIVFLINYKYKDGPAPVVCRP